MGNGLVRDCIRLKVCGGKIREGMDGIGSGEKIKGILVYEKGLLWVIMRRGLYVRVGTTRICLRCR